MNTRMKTLGAVAAFAAVALSIPTAVNAYADDLSPATPTTVAKVPDPQGRGCDAYKSANPSGAASFTAMTTVLASQALAANPDVSDFSAALSGQWNPEVNLTAVLDNGPYNVFAPTNAAFAAMDPATLAALKADPAALTRVLYYHMALGFLGPDHIHGKLTSQEGTPLTVTGKGADIKVNDTAAVVCGGLTSKNARIYMIDTVLDPAAVSATTSATTSAEATATTSAEATATTSAEATPSAPTSTTVAPGTPTTTAPAPAPAA